MDDSFLKKSKDKKECFLEALAAIKKHHQQKEFFEQAICEISRGVIPDITLGADLEKSLINLLALQFDAPDYFSQAGMNYGNILSWWIDDKILGEKTVFILMVDEKPVEVKNEEELFEFLESQKEK